MSAPLLYAATAGTVLELQSPIPGLPEKLVLEVRENVPAEPKRGQAKNARRLTVGAYWHGVFVFAATAIVTPTRLRWSHA